MPPPETTAPSTTPDETPGNTVSSADEAEFRRASDDELRAFWHQYIVDRLIANEDVEEYVSPTKDVELENRINTIIDQEVNELFEKPELVKVNPYDFHVKKPNLPQQTESKADQGADPVNLFNGNFVYSTTDFQVNGAGIDFVFTRVYSQLSLYDGPLGFSWDHSYNLWLRVDNTTGIIYRSTGRLSQEIFRKHEQYDYWIPPDGVAGIIVENGDSFVLRFSDGSKIIYQPHQTLHPSIHVVARIEDRFGNYLRFSYPDGLLESVQINHQSRTVVFKYDTQNRITKIIDFSGRFWQYHYDDLGDLAAVTTPATNQYKKGLTTCYEYMGSLTSDTNLQHNLISIIDADGRLYLENEYGSAPNLLSYGRVIRQRQGSGDIFFDYADVIEDFDFPYETHERPTHQTIVTERDGRQCRYLFNRLGNMIFKEEYARLNGLPKLVSSHYRYNKDGNLIGTISPLGVITQVLYGRDFYERQFPPDNDYRPETDPNLTQETRLQFEILLAVVKRAKYYDVNALNLAGGLWSAGLFPDILATNDEDVIQKFTYESEFSQLLTTSDPRFTQSTNPVFPEDAEYHRRLTKYSYVPGMGFQHLLLESVELPTPILPDGTLSTPIITRFTEYDQNGRIIRIVAPNGLEMLNSYSVPPDDVLEGFLKSITIDPNGFNIKTGMERDQLGRVVKSLHPQFFDFNDDRYFSTTEYNELNQIVKSTSTAPFSISTHYSYTRAGNILRSEIDLKDHMNMKVGTFVTNNRYDEEFNLIAQKVGDSDNNAIKQTKVLFDRASRPFLSIAPSGRKNKTSFNERSLVAKTIQDYGGVHATTRAYYDADGRLVRVIDPRGFITKFAYDTLGRPVDTEDARGNRIIKHFDKIGNLLAECLYEKVAENAFVLLSRREFSYDELGRRIIAGVNKFVEVPSITAQQLRDAFKESGPGELLTNKSFYDNVGNLVKQVDQDGREFISEFDVLGRVTKKIDPNGNELRFRYDKEGNVLRVDRQEVTRDPATNAALGTRHFAEVFAYDELNRLVEQKTSIGELRYKYDSRGQPVEIDDPLGNKFENTYDIFGRLTENCQSFHRYEPGDIPIPVRTILTYDLDDQQTTQTDALGRMTRFQYDSAGRLISLVLPDGSADMSTYDRSGNVIQYRDRNGLLKEFSWDELNRNTALQIDTSELAEGIEFSGAIAYKCKYDALGRFKTVENDYVVNRFAYDSLSDLLEEITSFTPATGLDPLKKYSVKRRFANSGALIGLTYPSNREIRYSRDILDHIVKIEQVQKGDGYPGDPTMPNNLTIADIDYEGLQVKKISRHNGISTEFKYDFGGRTVEIGHSKGADNILTLQFLYDALGNIRQKIEVAEDFRGTESFKYDSLSRLFETKKSNAASLLDLSSIVPLNTPLPDILPDHQSQINQLISVLNAQPTSIYDYDLVGNRLSRNLEGTSEIYKPNELDQYEKVGNNSSFRYDKNGNLIADDAFHYAYNHQNQLVKIRKKANGQEINFFFDYLGRRCLQEEGANLNIFLYDGHNLLEAYEEDQLTRSIISTTKQDDLLISSSSGSDFYLLSDLTRSVRYVFDGANKRNFYIYDEFGDIQNSLIPIDDNPFRFAGKRLLADTGKYDFIYRTYDPSLGKFIQRDPKGFIDGTNLYVFVGNNPLRFVDEFGTDRKERNPEDLNVSPVVAQGVGKSIVEYHPSGETLPLSNFTSQQDIREYKKAVRERNIVSRPDSTRSQRRDPRSRAALEEFQQREEKPSPQHQAGHKIDLQHDRTRRHGFDWRDYRWELGEGVGNNMSRGPKNRWLRQGLPTDVPVGGVAREQDINKFWNRPPYRTGMRMFGIYTWGGGTISSLSSLGDDIREGNWGSAALNASSSAGSMLEGAGMLANSSRLMNFGRVLGAPAAVVSSGVIGVRIGTNLYENYVDREMYMDAGSWVEEKTGSRTLGAIIAANVAVADAIVHAPEAAIDYAKETWTLNPSKIDWGRTFSPWSWF
jgi:RHS repeat-associated protein